MKKIVRSNSDTSLYTDNKREVETMNENLVKLKRGIKKERKHTSNIN